MNSYVNDFNENVKTYYRELKKYKPLTQENEKICIQKAKSNDIKERNKLITSNLKFVFKIAKMYKGHGVDLDELISEGNLGLIKAIDRFDETKNVTFLSYAVWWIKQSMQECIKRNKKKNSFELKENDLIGNNNQNEDNNDSEENLNGIDIVDENIIDNYDEKKINIIKDIIQKLPAKVQYIINSYYGLNNEKPKTLAEIGKALNLSQERIRKIKEKNLRYIRTEILSNKMDMFF